MKNLFLFIFAIATIFTANAVEPTDSRIKVKPGSMDYIHFDQRAYVDRISVRVRRQWLASRVDKAGILNFYVNGRQVDCIDFYSNTDVRWRTYILDVRSTVETLEVYNGLDSSVIIKEITIMPRRIGIPSGPNQNPLPGDVGFAIQSIADHLMVLADFTTPANFATYLAPVKASGSRALNSLMVNGPSNADTIKALKSYIADIDRAQPLLKQLESEDATFYYVQEINIAYEVIKKAL